MPFYEYQCKNCGHDLEVMQKINELPLKKCPQCGKSQLQRLMSAPVFRLKGAGWYETDFKGDKENRRNLADRPDADTPKDAAPDASKDTKDGAVDGAVKDGNGKDAKADTAPGKEATPKEKTADKPSEKAATEPVKKPEGGKSSRRAHTPGRGKSAAKRPIKRPVHKAKRRV
jgi:putative FmdB family regulatory protein